MDGGASNTELLLLLVLLAVDAGAALSWIAKLDEGLTVAARRTEVVPSSTVGMPPGHYRATTTCSAGKTSSPDGAPTVLPGAVLYLGVVTLNPWVT